jgi:uncharacterized membrane protein
MTKQEFILQLQHKLLDSGISETLAKEKCDTISNNFSKLPPDDAAKYYTEANVSMVADKLIKEMAPEGQTPTIVIDKTKTQAPDRPEKNPEPVIRQKPAVEPTKITSKNDVVFVHKEGDVASGRSASHQSSLRDRSSAQESGKYPKLFRALVAILCTPTLIFIVALALGGSLAIAVAMAGVILFVICAIAGIVCGGSILSAVSLLYGISQVISEPRYVGLHEIGLALIFAGVTILICVLLYNLAVRFIPLLYRLIGEGLRLGFKKLKNLISTIRKGRVNL